MRLYQNKDKTKWYFEFMLEGKRYNKACKGATNPKEAEQFAYDYKSNIYKGNQGYTSVKAIKLNKLIEIFLDYSEANKKTHYMDLLFTKYFLEVVGNIYIDGVTPAMIEKYKLARQQKVANSSINRELDSIKRMFSIAVENKYLKENPCSRVKSLRVENKKERFITPDEEKRLLNQCIDDKAYLKPIILMALHTGMRKGEILSLTWACVNFTQNYITILNPKSGKPRIIPVLGELLEELGKLPKSNEYVFFNPKTQKPYDDIQRAFQSAVKSAGIEKLRFHDLRHTAATRMIASGSDIITVQDILGHADIRMTQRYSHPVPERKLLAIKALNDYK